MSVLCLMCVQMSDSLVTIYLGPWCETELIQRVSICPGSYLYLQTHKDYFYLKLFLMSPKLFVLLFTSGLQLTFLYIFATIARQS